MPVDGHFKIAVAGYRTRNPDRKIRARIFEEFQQVDNSITRQKGGTGLGLSIARRLINVHGGHIDLEFDAREWAPPSTLSCRYARRNRGRRHEQTHSGHRGHREQSAYSQRFAHQCRLRSVEAIDGEKGVAMAAEQRPDLILMDIQLPIVDGYEATRRIKSTRTCAHIPIIAVTSYALSGDEAKAFAAGCDGYFAKPFSPARDPRQSSRIPDLAPRGPSLANTRLESWLSMTIPPILKCCASRLDSQGYEVVTAVDGEDALVRARELEPDLVLLDVMMPKLDGISVLKELKQDAIASFYSRHSGHGQGRHPRRRERSRGRR